MQSSLHIGNYSLLYRIGCGSFASVYMGINDLIGYPVAIKQIRREIYSTEKEKIRLLREISILKNANHQYIAELFEIIDNEDEPYIYLVLELVSNGSLKSLLVPGQPLSEDLSRKIFSQLIVAVGYLHFNLNVIHRDLKAENILLDQNQNIRLIDFGLSTTIEIPSPDIQRTACGSPAYAAPEIIVQDSYTESADIWSLGILLYLMTTGHFPFDTSSVTKLLNDIVSAPIEIPTNLSPELQNLLSKILEKNAKARISLIDIMRHPWFTNNSYFSFMNQGHLYRSYESKLNLNSLKKSLDLPNSATKSSKDIKKFDKDLFITPFESLVLENSIDDQVIEELRRKGVDVLSLKSSLMNHEMNEVTACYRIISRSKTMERFNVSYYNDKNSTDISDNYINPGFFYHLQQHQANALPVCRISSYPVNDKSIQDKVKNQKNELRSTSIAANAAKILLPRPRKNPSSLNKKANAESCPQPSNVPTIVVPRKNQKRTRLIYSAPKSLNKFEMQPHQKEQMNEALNEAANVQQLPPQPQIRNDIQQEQQNGQMILLKEQYQQQQ